MPQNNSQAVLARVNNQIKIASSRMTRDSCSGIVRAHLLWGVARAAANAITNELHPDDTSLLLEIVVIATTRIGILTSTPKPGKVNKLEDDLDQIKSKINVLVGLPYEIDQPFESVRQITREPNNLSLSQIVALADLQNGVLKEGDEDTLIDGFLTGEQQEHRRKAVLALRAAGSCLRVLREDLRPIQEPE